MPGTKVRWGNVSLFAAAIAGLIVLWQWATFAAWANSSVGVATWVQAIGTLGAIYGGLWIGVRTIGEQKQQLARRSLLVSFRLSSLLEDLLAKIAAAKHANQQLQGGLLAGPLNNALGKIAILRILYNIPDDLIQESWTVGPRTSLNFIRLLSALEKHNAALDNIEGAMLTVMEEGSRRRFIAGVSTSLDRIEGEAQQLNMHAKAAVEAVTKAPVTWDDD